MQWSSTPLVKENAACPLGWGVSQQLLVRLSYRAVSLVRHVVSGRKPVLQAPSTIFFLLMVPGLALFLEVSPSPLLGYARMSGAGKGASSLFRSPTVQYIRHLSFLYLCKFEWGKGGKLQFCSSPHFPAMAFGTSQCPGVVSFLY